jgi:MoxR-like ATPase
MMDNSNVRPIAGAYAAITHLRQHMQEHIIGQDALITRLLIALLCDGHLLVEGAPGLAKTRAIKTLATGIEASFHRIQFTPDLLPGDLTGTDIYHPDTGKFSFQQGPIFHNLILADEINRAPAKVQSALLEAMEERQVTLGRTTYPLPELFLVMATQNPIEQEGTYPLPEAQLDRFLLYVRINYPESAHELEILELARSEARQGHLPKHAPKAIINMASILSCRQAVLNVHMSEALQHYVVQLILATRKPEYYNPTLSKWLRYGASPRATIALDRAARAHAWLGQRDFVTPEDIQSLAHDVLRHRIILNFEAEAEGITTDEFITEIIRSVPVP